MLSKLARKAFNEYLLLTNFTLASTFMTGGDILAQKVTKDGPNDWKRTRSLAIMGMGFGIMGHYWYMLLDKRFPGKSWLMIRNKLLCECAATPVFAGYTFLAFGKLQGKTMSECCQDFKDKIHYVCIVDWCAYVPAQAVNFYFLPPRFRFSYVCALSVVYDMFLAWLLNKEDESEMLKEGKKATE